MPRTSYTQATQQAAIGAQDVLVYSAVPATALQTLLGQRVAGSVLSVVGDYFAEFEVAGLTEVEVHIRATLGGTATCTTDIYTTYFDEVTKKMAFAGIGALVSATIQTATLGATKGPRIVRVKLTVAGAGTVTFTLAEYNGA